MGKVSAAMAAAAVIATTAIAGSPVASYAGGQGRSGGSHERLLVPHPGDPKVSERTPERAAPRAMSTSVNLGISRYSDIVVDPTHKHVFISGGSGTSGVVVTDLAGKKLETLGSTPGASGMTLSPNGDTLYVALADGDGIREIDTSTLAGTTVSTGASTCPQDVAVTAGTVWFGYACDGGNGAVGSLDPSTDTVHTGVITGLGGTPVLTASPGLDGVLFTGLRGVDPTTIAKYDVTGGDTPTGTLVTSREAGDNLGDFVETPDGTDVIVASGAPYYQQVYSTTDLSADGTYTTSNYPDAVAVNEDGQIAAGISASGSKSVWLYKPGAAKAFKTISFADGEYLQPRGLAFTGQTVYAVTGGIGAGNGPFYLNVESTKPNAPMTISTNGRRFRYGAKAHVTVRLNTGDSHHHVLIYAVQAGQNKPTLVKSGQLKGGRLSATYHVKKWTMFAAVYTGGKNYGETVKTLQVRVHAKVTTKAKGAYAHRGAYALFHKGKDPHWLTTVAPNHQGECVVLQAEYFANGSWQALQGSGECVLLSSGSKALGVLQGTHVAGERARVRGVWTGDAYNLKQTGKWSYVRFTS